MSSILKCSLLALLAGIASAQSPTISAVVNAASGIGPGLPNSGLAQGGIFLIVGSNLGPANINIASNAFQSTTLGGTSASITVGGQTVGALLYYTSATQVSALLPSNTPLGPGSITVTYNGKTSPPAPISVVQNNLGIFTVTQNGSGSAILTYPDYSLVTTAKSANPGDALILWATGLGPVSSDTSTAPLGVNMPSIPLKVWIGGVSAPIIYQGRSGCCIGEDQIVFTVPNNAPQGCAVPIAVQINDQISNYAVMPIASGSRSCPLVTSAIPQSAAQQLASGATTSYFSIVLRRDHNSNASGYNDNVKGASATLTVPTNLQPFILSYLDNQPAGTCVVYNSINYGAGTPPVNLGSLDIGGGLTVMGPNGTRTVDANSQVLSAAADYLVPGPYTLTTPGGKDVPSFSTMFTIPQPPSWTNPPGPNPSSIGVGTRSQGVTFTWSGGAAGDYVEIDGGSATDGSFKNGASFVCTAPLGAGTFTVPPSVLLALPAGNNVYYEFKPNSTPVSFAAKGLNIGLLSSYYDTQVVGSGISLK